MAFPDTTPSPARVHPILWVMAALMVAIEASMHLAELGFMPDGFHRWQVYARFAFHDQVFEFARQSGAVPPSLVWSLQTYAFLHGGWLHLILNTAVFLALGHAIIQATDVWAMLALFVLTSIAGAVTMGVLTQTHAPLVGASGAIFGFLGAFTAWQERLLARAGMSRSHIWKRVIGLGLLNVIMAIAIPSVAWEAHVGGFVMGWIFAAMYPSTGLALQSSKPSPPSDPPEPPTSGAQNADRA